MGYFEKQEAVLDLDALAMADEFEDEELSMTGDLVEVDLPAILREKTYEVEDHVSPHHVIVGDRDDEKQFFENDMDRDLEDNGKQSRSDSIISMGSKQTMATEHYGYGDPVEYGSGGSIVEQMMNDFDDDELVHF